MQNILLYMQEVKGLVSIIIPAYNAGSFIGEAINSIITMQDGIPWELIVVNDGSSDNTASVVASFEDPRIKLINQVNTGVSIARNNGLVHAKGEYVCFFDADDLMTPGFLQVRTNELGQNRKIGFVGGLVETFPDKTPVRRAVAEDPETDIHFFIPMVSTVPSNYLLIRSVITEHKIIFNPLLNSSADRYFLLEVANYTTGKSLNTEKGKLMYRISESSMSHHVTPKLTLDYRKFYEELNSRNLLPVEKRREIKSMYLFSLALSFWKIKYRGSGCRHFFLSFATHPLVFFS